jgi:phosphatidylethanolamine-binding protein (PEBP) family uncharacterized protein
MIVEIGGARMMLRALASRSDGTQMRRVWIIALLLACSSAVHADPRFTVTSPDLRNGGGFRRAQLNVHDFCGSGGGRSPALNWANPPAGTKYFGVTLTYLDPLQPSDPNDVSWGVAAIPPDTVSLASGAGAPGGPPLPPGAVQGITEFGVLGWVVGYTGPCWRQNTAATAYQLEIWALDGKGPFFNGSPTTAMRHWFKAHALGVARIGLQLPPRSGPAR